MRRYFPFLIILGVLLLAFGAGLLLFRYRAAPPPPPPAPASPAAAASPAASASPTASELPSAPPTLSPPTTASPPAIIPSAAGPVFNYGRPGAEPMHLRGEASAPVVLEEFGDFECLPCALLWPILGKLEQDYGKQLVVVFRERPLTMHHFALDAARAAEAAGLQGKFWEMHDTLYRNRATWVPAQYIGPYLNEYATQIGLDLDRFKTDVDGPEVAQRMAAEQDRGDSLGIDRTPVLFLNGEKLLPTQHNDKSLREAIDKALGAKPQ